MSIFPFIIDVTIRECNLYPALKWLRSKGKVRQVDFLFKSVVVASANINTTSDYWIPLRFCRLCNSDVGQANLGITI